MGVTALYDAGTKELQPIRVFAFLSKLDKAGELPLRYEGDLPHLHSAKRSGLPSRK